MRPNVDKPARRKSSRADASAERRAELIDQHVAERLRVRREELGISQEDFAQRAGMTLGTLKKFEAGATAITAGRLLVIAETLGCEPDYFFAQFEERPAKML